MWIDPLSMNMDRDGFGIAAETLHKCSAPSYVVGARLPKHAALHRVNATVTGVEGKCRALPNDRASDRRAHALKLGTHSHSHEYCFVRQVDGSLHVLRRLDIRHQGAQHFDRQGGS